MATTTSNQSVLKTIPRSSCLNLGLNWPGGEVSWGCRPVGPTLVTTCSQKISCAIGSTSHRSDTKDSSRRWNSAGGQSIAAKKKRAAEAALFASIAYAAPLLIRRHVLKRRPDVRIAQLNSPGRRDSIPVVPVVRDSPDESPIGVNICAFAVLLQDRSAVRTDAITSASWTAVEELIWPFPLAFGHARPVGCNLNAWATERLMLALVAAAAAVPR